MRIWIIIAYDPVPRVDVGARILRYGHVAETFLQAGHEVVFWTSTFNHAKKVSRYETDQRLVLDSRYSVQFLHAQKYTTNSSLMRVLHNRSIAAAFTRHAEEQCPPDIIFAGIPCVELSQAAVAYGLKFRVPVVLDVQDLWPDIYLTVFPKAFHRWARFFLQYEFARAQWTCRNATAITAVSRTYLKWGVQKARRGLRSWDRVFHLGSVDPLRFGEAAFAERSAHYATKFGISPQNIHVVYLGQFGRSYDVGTIIRAAEISQNCGQNRLKFVLIGGGDAEAGLRRRARRSNNVQFMGWLNGDDATGVLSLCAIGLAAYVERATQSLPYKPFEYMAVGLPILSSLRSELRMLIEAERIGFQYQAGDPHSLADAVRELALNESYRRQAGMRARAVFKRDFDASVIYPELMEHLIRISLDGTEEE